MYKKGFALVEFLVGIVVIGIIVLFVMQSIEEDVQDAVVTPTPTDTTGPLPTDTDKPLPTEIIVVPSIPSALPTAADTPVLKQTYSEVLTIEEVKALINVDQNLIYNTTVIADTAEEYHYLIYVNDEHVSTKHTDIFEGVVDTNLWKWSGSGSMICSTSTSYRLRGNEGVSLWVTNSSLIENFPELPVHESLDNICTDLSKYTVGFKFNFDPSVAPALNPTIILSD